ncbi:MAG: MOSC domain-containing protein [Sulfurovum sp.]|nr:MOSC domain-containing protein [Sulfurovum sp.]
MIKVGKIFSLFYTPPTGRTNVESFSLDSKGILNDKHYAKDISRSVLLTSLDSYALAKDHGIDARYGVLGENVLIDYNPYHLRSGARLKIGNVIFEISQACTLCKSLTNIDSKLPKLLKDDRGIFAKVLEEGSIKEGDDIYLLD